MENTNKAPIQISLAIAMKQLYKVANHYSFGSYFLQFLLFFLNLYLIVFKPAESNGTMWGLLLLSIGIVIFSAFFLHKSKLYYELGESVRKMDMIERVFPNAANSAGKSYLIAKIPGAIIRKAQDNPHKKTDYYTDRKDKYEQLIENIQQNCYFTSELMRSYSNTILLCIYIILILFSFSIIYGFFILSENGINQQLSKSIAGYLALFVNFIFTLNIIDYFMIFKKKAEQLKKIDEDLNNIKNSPHEDEIITSFTAYNCILCDALPYPSFVYERNKDKLNRVWENRVNND